MGISQLEASRMFKGNFRECSIERLMGFLVSFDRDVDAACCSDLPNAAGPRHRREYQCPPSRIRRASRSSAACGEGNHKYSNVTRQPSTCTVARR
jgi:hypothetical protein